MFAYFADEFDPPSRHAKKKEAPPPHRKSQSAVEGTGARDWATAPRHPRMVEFAERVREQAAEHTRQQEKARRVADTERTAKALADLPGSARRERGGGQPYIVTQLTPDSVIRLVAGEPLRYAPKAA